MSVRRGWRVGHLGAFAALVACGVSPDPEATTPVHHGAAAPRARAQLPDQHDLPFAPALLRAAPLGEGVGARIADVDGCAECHTDAFAGWRSSAHSFASFDDPVYRVAVERLRLDRDKSASRMCAGCHDVALLVDGAMDREIRPDDPRAHAGVSCRVCHGITKVRADGNGSFDLDTSPIPVPRQGDAASLRRHRESVARPALREPELCLGCHKSFLDTATGNAHHLVGQDDASPWARSAFAGSHAARVDEELPERDCRGCHMPREPAVAGDPGAKNGTIASHAFLGAHTWMAQIQRDPALQRKATAFLQGSATIDVVGLTRASGEQVFLEGDPAPVAPGERLVIDVVVKNQRTGHRFPGGVMDAQDTWVEVVLTDARGRRWLSAGAQHAATGADPSAHRFFAHVAGADGQELRRRETHAFRAGVYNNTIAPRDAVTLRYGLRVPAEAASPLTVHATLLHRTRNLTLQQAACADAKTDRGRAFARESPKQRGRAFDPCEPQPITRVDASAAVLGLPTQHPDGLGEPASRARASAAFARAFAWAQGLSHALQEHLDEARYPITVALARAGSERERAMAMGLLAELEAKQGRREAAFVAAHKAEDLLGVPHPALARIRGEALLAEWAWGEAGLHLAEAARLAPRDDSALAALAMAWGGAGEQERALSAATRGLLLQPRDADLLRVQSLVLDAIGADPETCALARAEFLTRRAPDDAPAVRARCSKLVPGCALERNPVHVTELTTEAEAPREARHSGALTP